MDMKGGTPRNLWCLLDPNLVRPGGEEVVPALAVVVDIQEMVVGTQWHKTIHMVVATKTIVDTE